MAKNIIENIRLSSIVAFKKYKITNYVNNLILKNTRKQFNKLQKYDLFFIQIGVKLI